jgi:nuclear GTP-binding protein
LAKAAKAGKEDDDEVAMKGDRVEGADGLAEDDDLMDEDDGGDDVNPMAALIASARRAAEKYDRELQSGSEMDDDEGDSDDEDEFYAGNGEPIGPATSRRAYDKVFKQVIEQADVVLYVLDARDPEGTRSKEVERQVMAAASGGKRLMLVLNKIDLVPPPVLKDWLTYLRRYFPTIPLRASGSAPNAQTFNHKALTVQSTATALLKSLKSYAASKQLKRAVSVGVIGYPNVGKSSVINALLSRLGGKGAACPAGAEAGVTTSIRSVKIDSKLTLLDSPGVVFPSAKEGEPSKKKQDPTEAHANLVLLNAVPPKDIGDARPAVTLLLKRLSTSPDLLQKLMDVYDLPPLMTTAGDPTTDFLVQVARKRGRLSKGGVPNVESAATTVVTDWRDGRIQGWVDAPVLPVSVNASAASVAATSSNAAAPDQKQIVTEWAQEFKLDGLWGDDEAEDDAMEQ